MKQSKANKESVKGCLCVLLLVFFLSSCSREDKDVKILKKVSKDYVTAFSNDFESAIKSLKENSIVVEIRETDPEEYLSLRYPNYSIYVFLYVNDFDRDIKRGEIPSKLFYVKGYPVALYSNHLPAMKRSDIPESVFRKKEEGIWVDDGCTWYVVICKKSHKYKVLPDPYLQPDSVIFGQGLKDFSCD